MDHATNQTSKFNKVSMYLQAAFMKIELKLSPKHKGKFFFQAICKTEQSICMAKFRLLRELYKSNVVYSYWQYVTHIIIVINW